MRKDGGQDGLIGGLRDGCLPTCQKSVPTPEEEEMGKWGDGGRDGQIVNSVAYQLRALLDQLCIERVSQAEVEEELSSRKGKWQESRACEYPG